MHFDFLAVGEEVAEGRVLLLPGDVELVLVLLLLFLERVHDALHFALLAADVREQLLEAEPHRVVAAADGLRLPSVRLQGQFVEIEVGLEVALELLGEVADQLVVGHVELALNRVLLLVDLEKTVDLVVLGKSGHGLQCLLNILEMSLRFLLFLHLI